MPHGSLGAKKIEDAELYKYTFLLKVGSVEMETSESESEV